MILILAERDDPFAGRVQDRLKRRGRPVRRLSEVELREQTPLSIEREGARFGGFLRLAGGDLPLSDFTGVLVRLPRRWWPSAAFDPPDQMFVYHETTAALFCLLSGMGCPLVNRFDLGWWLCDPSYPVSLREGLGDRLGLRTEGADPEAAPVSIYVVDGRLIPASREAVPAADRLASRAGALDAWQQTSGIRLCRLDMSAGADPILERVEPCPSLLGEAGRVVEQVTTAALEILQ